MQIRPARPEDADALWGILGPIIRAGETYALARDMGRDDALAYWMNAEKSVFVAEENGRILGTYYLRANQPRRSGGGHVSNCGYVVAARAAGQGVGRAMCHHSLGEARTRGYKAMQFNLVVSTNEPAVRLWRSCGFTIIGRLPGAFLHPVRGYVDGLVMFQQL